MNIENFIREKFSEWLEGCQDYRIGDKEFYRGINKQELKERDCINPFLISEDDIKVKFGGYLETRLREINRDFTVHAELRLYGAEYPRKRADLSVHKVENNGSWQTNGQMIDSLRGIIEIKYITFKNQDYYFKNGGIESDINKLASKGSTATSKFMIIIDEAMEIGEAEAEKMRNFAKQNNVSILSNNQYLAI